MFRADKVAIFHSDNIFQHIPLATELNLIWIWIFFFSPSMVNWEAWGPGCSNQPAFHRPRTPQWLGLLSDWGLLWLLEYEELKAQSSSMFKAYSM